ncbi:flagellar basal body-associated FliL family protein [Dyella tabacisoli]|uniref:Flagellar protein FliL n=1 Tax=Dyella tabacisoli TaxID=2282381 RepID=A0A369UI09_9GAMM|nr:flagellar basal body-associated FliL family protein [Dyella tabacisoli]RDD79745.1 flagellar basal body protein FliL [Dyella tabacisoli]
MAVAESAPNLTPAKKGVSRSVVVILLFALLLVSAIGGYALFALRKHSVQGGETVPAESKSAVKQPELYLQLEPSFVVNFHNEESLSYLQVSVTLMAHDAAAIQAAKDADPVIRNALVFLFSSQDGVELSSTDGKQKLQAKALVAVQKIIADKLGKPGIDALYFTSFVMQ